MRQSFRFLGLILFVLTFGRTLLGEGNQVASHLSVRQQADSILHNLNQNLQSASTDQSRAELLVRSEKEIQNLRQKNPLQFRTDEMYLDSVSLGLKTFSGESDFSADACDKRRKFLMQKRFIAQASAQSAQSNLLEVLGHLCQSE